MSDESKGQIIQSSDVFNRSINFKPPEAFTFELKRFQELAPHLDWSNATKVPWEECVRDPKRQPIPGSDIAKIYYQNNQALRIEFLKMIGKIITGEIKNIDDFKINFAQLHTVLIMGKDGQNIYMNPGHQRKIGARSPADIAGNMQKDERGWNEKLTDLYPRIRRFISSENFSTHNKTELVQQVGEIFFENLNGYSAMFAYGNNSLNMNITNGLLRLTGLNGIPHGNLDIEFITRMNREKFYDEFKLHVIRSM